MPGSVIGQVLNFGYPGNVARSADAIIENRSVKSTDSINISFGDPVVLNSDNTYSKFNTVSTTLTAALASGTAYTSLSVQALANTVQAGDSIVIGAAGQTVTASADAATGATTIDVNSFTANAAYATGTAVAASNTPSQFAGVAIREVKQATDYYPVTNSYQPGQRCDVLERGSVTVTCQLGSPTAGGPVYVRIATNANYPNAVIGGFEAQADGSNSVQLTNAQWKTNQIDGNNVAEMTLVTRNKA